MTCCATSVTSAGMSVLASSISLIATAWWWWGIIIWVTMTSASLCSAETCPVEAEAVPVGVGAAAAEVVGVEVVPVPPLVSVPPHAVRARSAVRAGPVKVGMRLVGVVLRRVGGGSVGGGPGGRPVSVPVLGAERGQVGGVEGDPAQQLGVEGHHDGGGRHQDRTDRGGEHEP